VKTPLLRPAVLSTVSTPAMGAKPLAWRVWTASKGGSNSSSFDPCSEIPDWSQTTQTQVERVPDTVWTHLYLTMKVASTAHFDDIAYEDTNDED
jgi:hypothetical protein